MIFNHVLDLMENPDNKALDKSLADCHVDGVFSLVVGGEKDSNGELIHGTLTRIFIATKKISPFDIQFHSHRYSLTIGVISGSFEHHIAKSSSAYEFYQGDASKLNCYEYKSPINGGTGLAHKGEGLYTLSSYKVPVGAEIYLPHDLLHTVSCKKGTIWIVKEHGFEEDSSVVLGTSFQTEGLYNQPKQFQINDMFTLVYGKLNKLVNDN